MNLDKLSKNIIEVHKQFQQKAVSAVNISLTLRNWFIGYYIVEYDQNGEDRAKYGAKALQKLSKALKAEKLKSVSVQELRMFRTFYKVYYYFSEILLNESEEIRRALPFELQDLDFILQKRKALPFELENEELRVPTIKILTKLSYTHFSELLKIENPLKRAFYEIECINGTWSTRELQRQISTLYYERSGLSKDKEALSKLVNDKTEDLQPSDLIKNPMTFDFLNLPTKVILEENELEQALIDNLQQFLLELGNGFCFESRQKRILIDDEFFYIDLVFYHRILKCHVLVEIKNEKFTHENMGQLNVYLQYFKHEIMQKGDNPPVGILLCTESKKDMVRYARAVSEQVFVSEYKLNLPTEKEIYEYVKTKVLKTIVH